MGDFMKSPENIELPDSGSEFLVEHTMLEIGKTAELAKGRKAVRLRNGEDIFINKAHYRDTLEI